MFIVYLNENYKLCTHQLKQVGADIYCPPIDENNIIIGCYINGRKYLIKEHLSDIEIYYNMEILTNIEFVQKHHFEMRGRTFLISLLTLVQISCTETPIEDQTPSLNETFNTNSTNDNTKINNEIIFVEGNNKVNSEYIFNEIIIRDGIEYLNFLSINEKVVWYCEGYNFLEVLNVTNVGYIKSIKYNDANRLIDRGLIYQSQLEEFIAPNVLSMGSNAIVGPNKIKNLSFPLCTSLDLRSLGDMNLINLDLSSLQTTSVDCFLGTTVQNLTIPRALETSNAGGVNSEIQKLIDLGTNINYID